MPKQRGFALGIALVVLVLSLVMGLSSGLAVADEPSAEPPPQMPVSAADPGGKFEPETDPAAAEALPKEDLDRGQAEELLQEVFGEELEVPAEFFDDLEVEAFRSDHVAVVEPSAPNQPAGLLSSTLPLRAENEFGEREVIDLDLEHNGAFLQAENPLVDVKIPSELADGISLPEAGIDIKLVSDSGGRTGSEVGEASAFYPNVRPETDVAITSVPTGVETYTQLRSAEAPRQEVFDLSIPAGSTLSTTKAGGAEVVSANGEAVLSIPTPWAMDAAGTQVPTKLDVDGNSITVTVDPPTDAAYPILVDPVFQSYNFNGKDQTYWNNDWTGAENSGFIYAWGWPDYGMNVVAWPEATTSGNQAMFNYYVPRYWTEVGAGREKPSSYIRDMKLWNLSYLEPDETEIPAQNRAAYPFMQLSLWDENHNQFVYHLSRFGYEGQWTDGSYVFDMTNPNENPDVKHGGFAIATFDSRNSNFREVNVQQASVELTDKDVPSWGYMPSPSGWVNQTPKAIEYEVSDAGLGIYSLRMVQPQASGGSKTVTTGNGCVGIASNPCPRSTTNTSRTIGYEPQTMAQGEDTLSAYALDPVGNTSAQKSVKVKVDHTAPQLALSGNLTEQASVGTKLHEYNLNYNATDGDDAVAAAQTPFGTQGTGAGLIERPQGVAVDVAGNVWVSDKDNNRVLEFDPSGKVLRELPSGTADGQISSPRGIAIAPNGNVWIAEAGNKRLQQFTPAGVFVSKVTNASFIEPWGIAFGPEGSLWVTDNGAGRIFKFSEGGVLQLNELSSQLNSGVPYGIDVDAFGHPWIAFQGTDQVVEGEIWGANNKLRSVFTFGGTGTAVGQFRSPYDIAVAKSGNILVTDALNNRVQDFKPDGTFLRQYGAEGVASNQFREPRAVAVGPGDTLVVADAGNHRVARWAHADQDPQSGVTKLEVKVDGAVAKSTAPGCSPKNCAIGGSWTLNANSYSAGTHKVEVIATDGVGLATTKTLNVETHGDLVAPGVALSGSMTEQATVGTTRTTYKLKESATDTGSAAEWKSGVVATTIKVDGALVDSYNAACATEGCAVTREWTMQSSEYLGSHKVQVTATDGAGHVTTKELSITINKDVTPPKISTGGEAFFTQPQNWLVQKAYGYTTEATDLNASGVVNFQFKIDGAIVKQAYGICAGGSCAKTLTGELNILNYQGGAHAAELVATDAAGNVAKKTWTINVDPEGHISAGEATDTLEAVEDTAVNATEGTPVGGLVTNAPGEGGSNPQLVLEGSELVSVGAPTPSTVNLDPKEGFSVETSVSNSLEMPESETIEVVPQGISSGASGAQLTDGSAAVIANSQSTVDTVVRPAYDGLMVFQAIRDSAGAETYSWKVRLGEGESLKLIDEQHAGVFWEDGTEAMLITAQSAHDADGKAVATSLAITESNVVTLTVHHRVIGVTYPVVAGTGYEGGFQTVEGHGPPPTEQEPEPEYLEGLEWTTRVGAPELVTAGDSEGEAEASSNLDGYIKKWGTEACPPSILISTCGVWHMKFKGFFYFNFKRAWYPKNRSPVCEPFTAVNYSIDKEECAWVGPNYQPYENGYHVTARALWKVTVGYGVTSKSSHKHLVGRAFGDGEIYFHDTDQICNPSRPECG